MFTTLKYQHKISSKGKKKVYGEEQCAALSSEGSCHIGGITSMSGEVRWDTNLVAKTASFLFGSLLTNRMFAFKIQALLRRPGPWSFWNHRFLKPFPCIRVIKNLLWKLNNYELNVAMREADQITELSNVKINVKTEYIIHKVIHKTEYIK